MMRLRAARQLLAETCGRHEKWEGIRTVLRALLRRASSAWTPICLAAGPLAGLDPEWQQPAAGDPPAGSFCEA